ncbi:MAG: hypothetical protein AB1724_18890 [Thermodesulfobacteriota bacterium]
MNLKAKKHAEARKQQVQKKLTTCLDRLKEKGLDPKQIAKDPLVRQLRAEIREAGARLRAVAATEKLNSDKVVKKQEKEATREATRNQPSQKKKKSKAVPEKKEKKSKKGEAASAEKE